MRACDLKNGSCDPDPGLFEEWFVIHNLGYDVLYLSVNFDDSSFSHSRDMAGVHKKLNGSRNLTTHLLGTLSSVG